MIEYGSDHTPYANIPKLSRFKMSILEAPGGTVTFIRHLMNRERISIDQAQNILFGAVETLNGNMADNLKTSPKIDSYLGQGYEATVFKFTTKDGRWVMKVGHPNSPVPGIYSPATNEYAAMMKWNYAVLNRRLIPYLPNVLPSPYYVVAPSEINMPTTVQLLPYIDKITDFRYLTESQTIQLIKERKTFFDLSKQLITQDKVMPDMVGSKNLVVSETASNLHYSLLDIGLFNLRAPTPILNIWVYMFQRLSLMKDINSLKNAQGKKFPS